MSSFNNFIGVVCKYFNEKNNKMLNIKREVISMRSINKHFKRSLICLAVCSVSYGVNAVEVMDKAAANEKNVEVIMVTAQKRVQRIIDVPTSITAVDSNGWR